MLYFFVFLLFSGLYRLYDGKRRLVFEQQPDDRVNSIPDEDIVKLWHNLTKMNIQFGHFFQKYGLFITVCSVVNIILFFQTHLTIQQLIKDSGLFGFLLLFVLLFCCFLGLNETNRRDRIYTYNIKLLNFIWQKETIFNMYKLFHFYQRENWHKLASLDEQYKLGVQAEYHLFHGEQYKDSLEYRHQLNKEKNIMIGAVMRYLSWILVIIAITAYHGIKCYLIFQAA